MKQFLEDFKAFAMKGNVIDLATAVVIGTAFGKITTSLVNNIIMPFFGVVMGGINFSDKAVAVRGVDITYGVFVQSIIEFVIIAFAIFVLIRILSRLQKKEAEEVKMEKPKEPSEEVVLLREIRDSLQK